MSEALKRIEEKQPRESTWRYCSICVEKGQDIVKLARALDALLDAYNTAWAEAERTMEEVAGECE